MPCRRAEQVLSRAAMDESGKEKQMLANNSGGIMGRLILIDALKVGALYQNMLYLGGHCALVVKLSAVIIAN